MYEFTKGGIRYEIVSLEFDTYAFNYISRSDVVHYEVKF